MKNLLILIIIYISVFCPFAFAKPQEAVLLKVVDGDTLLVRLNNKEESVRLLGIDCYETYPNNRAYRQAYTDGITVEKVIEQGLLAKYYVENLLKPNDIIFLETDKNKHDKYNRLLAYVYLKDGTMLNKLLIKEQKAKYFIFPDDKKKDELLK